jgi:transketolase
MNDKELATKIRRHVLQMTHDAKCSHIGSALSCADILAVLYNDILRVKPEQPDWEDRDRFILSKGHACSALYAVLAERGFFPINDLNTFYRNDGLSGHVSHYISGVEASTGSLGHGLPIACGMALAGKRDKKDYRVFCLLSDGDLNEGSTWEAIMFAKQHKLDNLVAIVDYNQSQALGDSKNIINLDTISDKFRAFGWWTKKIDGHNLESIRKSLTDIPESIYYPTCIIAHTIKGKGVSFMEAQTKWHYAYPNDEELKKAVEELK